MKSKNKMLIMTICASVAFLLSLVVKITLVLGKDRAIVINGVKSFRFMNSASTAFIVITAVITIGMVIANIINAKRLNELQANETAKLENQRQLELETKLEREAYITSSNKLKDSTIQTLLKESFEGPWIVLKDDLKPLWAQSCKMDEFQVKLKNLLKKNNAEVLNDTEDILEEAEQNLLNNIRKVMNYMDIYDPNVEDERLAVQRQAKQSFEDNRVIVANVGNFLLSLIEYLNNQGSNNSLKTLNEYKEALKGLSSSQIPTPKEPEPVAVTSQLKF